MDYYAIGWMGEVKVGWMDESRTYSLMNCWIAGWMNYC